MSDQNGNNGAGGMSVVSGLFDDGPAFAPLNGNSPEDIEAFLKDILNDGPIDSLKLLEVNSFGNERLIRHLPVSALSPEDLSQNLMRVINGFAAGTTRRTTFILQAFKGNEQKGMHTIVRDAAYNGSRNGVMLEQVSNEQALLGMLMRHNEASARQSGVGVEMVLSYQSRIIKEQREEITRLRAEQIGVTQLLQQTMVASVDTELMRERGRMRLGIEKAIGDKAVEVLPLVVKKLTETKTLDAMGQMFGNLKTFVQSLKPEQLGAFMATLEPAQAAQLKGLLEATTAEDESGKAEGASE